MNNFDCNKILVDLLEWSKKLESYSLEELALNPIPPAGVKSIDHLADSLHILVLNRKKSEKKLQAFSKISKNSKSLGLVRKNPNYCLDLIGEELRVSEAAVLKEENGYYLPVESCFIEYLNNPTPCYWLNKSLSRFENVAVFNDVISSDINLCVSKDELDEKEGSHFLFAKIGSFDVVFMFHRNLGSPGFSSFDSELVQGLSESIRLIQENDELYLDVLKTKTDLDKINGELVDLNVSLERKVLDRTQDLSEAKQRAENAQQEAENANRSKSTFLAMMSHEFRTPLNGVLGMAQLLEATSLSAEQTNYVRTLHSAGQILLTLINDILDYSKIESGQMEIEERLFSLSDTTFDISSLLKNMANENEIEFSVNVDEKVKELIIGDKVRLRQILINLCNNAIKFTRKGSVKLQIEMLPATEWAPEKLYFSVTDTGIGISQENINKLFKPFVQAEVSTTRQFGGTGLGLAISKRLVVAMGGEIGVHSKQGKGSVFWFVLPCENIPQALEEEYHHKLLMEKQGGQVENEVMAMDLSPSEARILVVEDNLVNQMTIEALLEKEGFNCTMVDTGQLAIAAYDEQSWDLIFMDYLLPDMTGVDVTIKLRQFENERKSAHIPIVALTANAMESDKKMCLDAGMDFFVEKPIQRDKLKEALEILTQR